VVIIKLKAQSSKFKVQSSKFKAQSSKLKAQSSKMKRLAYIDIAKGIGIILVVLSHTVRADFMYYTAAFFVPIFFFCSGYTSKPIADSHPSPHGSSFSPSLQSPLPSKGRGRGGVSPSISFIPFISFISHLKRVLTRLLKPYLFFSILLLLIFHDFSLRAIAGIAYSRYCLYPFGTTDDICHFMIVGNYPLWFLTAMAVAYVLYDLLRFFPKYQYPLIALYLVATALMDHLPILLPWSIDTAPLFAIIIWAGQQVRRIASPNLPEGEERVSSSLKLPSPRKWLGMGLCTLLYLLSLLVSGDINISVRQYGTSWAIYLPAAITGCIMLTYFSRLLQGTLVGRGLQQIGLHSLTIFCIEIPFILAGEHIANYFNSHFAFLSFLSFPSFLSFFQLVFALAGGYLLSVLLHKNERIRRLVF